MKIAVIIPAFNESKHIAKVINEIKSLSSSYEVIVVDDCSSDDTVIQASQAGATVLQHIVNRGQGAALRTGTQFAVAGGYDIIVHFDADGQFMAEEIRDIIDPIVNNKAEVVFGSRFLEKKSEMPLLKENIIMPVARLVNLIFFGIKLTDPQSGFRALSLTAARKIHWQQDRMAHCSEIMHEVVKNGFKIQEVPITVIYHEFGQKFSGGFKILKDIFIGNFTK